MKFLPSFVSQLAISFSYLLLPFFPSLEHFPHMLNSTFLGFSHNFIPCFFFSLLSSHFASPMFRFSRCPLFLHDGQRRYDSCPACGCEHVGHVNGRGEALQIILSSPFRFALAFCWRHGLLQKGLSSASWVGTSRNSWGTWWLEKSGGIMFDKMWIFETNFSCFPFFRTTSCNMRVRNGMVLCFTLLLSNPKCFLVWILAVVSRICMWLCCALLFWKPWLLPFLCCVLFALLPRAVSGFFQS